jgi:hypothetical protein
MGQFEVFGSRPPRHACHNEGMLTRPSKGHDFATVARSVVELAIGEKLDGSPLENPNAGKSQAAIARGKLAGPKGGRSRAKNLTPEQRTDIARIAAEARWKKRS